MSKRRHTAVRVGTLLFLAAFLVQTAEGLSALACHDDVSPSQVHHGGHDHGPAEGEHQHDTAPSVTPDHSHVPDDGACPMGAAPELVCGASATAPPPPVPGTSIAVATGPLRLADPTGAADEHFPLSHFRPPRD